MGRLLCTDLDRTLIPNGPHPESPHAKEYLEHLLRKEDVILAYVTGRHRTLIEQAIEQYHLPVPNYAIADVGATIFEIDSDGWHQSDSWSTHLAEEWAGVDISALVNRIKQIPDVSLQESEKQSEFKVSFYLPLHADYFQAKRVIESYLFRSGTPSNLIWSIDEVTGVRLLDVLPSRANKLLAIRHLMQQLGFNRTNTLFAGDSGNDIDVLESDIPAVLVANADAEMKVWADRSKRDSLYVAQGGPWGMNGNYCAGILEGVMHYWPEVARSLDQLTHLKAN